MPHDTTLIATIAAAFVSALALGFVAARLRLPPLVGYLAAGILIGPFTPGFVGDATLAGQLAEIGVMLLMFGVGLHFSVKDLMAVRGIAIPGAVAQILTATAIGAALAHGWGWSLGAGITFGLSLSVASTVVLLRALEQRRALDSPEGRIAVGWLIVEDLAMVLALVLLPAFASTVADVDEGRAAAAGGGLAVALLATLAKVGLFVALALVVGTRVVPWLLRQVARTASRELFTLAVLAIALGIAFGSAELFGVSFALGAFFAGVVLSESELSHAAAEDSLPLQDAFAVLFFVSVGMLFDPSVVLREPLAVVAVLLVIVIGKSLAAFLIVLAFRYPVSTALTVSASLAQIGEFSFILIGLGVGLQLVPPEARDLVLAGALLSITLNPFVFAALPGVLRWLEARPALLARLERRRPIGAAATPVAYAHLVGHAIIVGHGRVGSGITPVLRAEGLPFVVLERDRRRFDAMRAAGVPAILGDAAAAEVLAAAGVERARLLVIATPDSFQARRVLEVARARNPQLDVVIRTHDDAELTQLREAGVDRVVMGERELARTMLHHALRSFGVPPERARLLVRDPLGPDLGAEAERR